MELASATAEKLGAEPGPSLRIGRWLPASPRARGGCLSRCARPLACSLRASPRPVQHARFDRTRPGWATSDGDLWFVAEHLVGVPHTRLLPRALERRLGRVDRRSLEAGLVGFRQK